MISKGDPIHSSLSSNSIPPPNASTDLMDASLLKDTLIHTVQLDASVVLKIIKHCKDLFPSTGTGQLLGVDVQGTLEISNCFPFR